MSEEIDLIAELDRLLEFEQVSPPLDDAIMAVRNSVQRLRGEVERLRGALGIFLGSDDRFQVAVGGNPIAIERMLDEARSALANLEREG